MEVFENPMNVAGIIVTVATVIALVVILTRLPPHR